MSKLQDMKIAALYDIIHDSFIISCYVKGIIGGLLTIDWFNISDTAVCVHNIHSHHMYPMSFLNWLLVF